MPNRSRGALALTAMLTATALAPSGASAAERFYGVTKSNRLVTFQSDSPSAIRATKPVKGLRGNEDIVGIDVRPSNGRLYAVTTASRLYTIAVRTGRARAVVSKAFGGPLRGSVGFDLNPTVDKLRLVTDTGRNFRVDPDSGQLIDGDPALAGTQGDRDLAYAADDPGSQERPHVGASAYTNSVAGATSTELFGIDTARDTLVLQNPPNDGVLNTVGGLRRDAGGAVGFDIAEDGGAYATFARRGRGLVSLYRINLSTGRATSAAAIDIVPTFRGRRSDPLRALAAAGRVADDRSPPRVRNRKLNDPRVSELLRGRALRLRVRCSEACVVQTQLLFRRQVVGGALGVILARPGRVTLRLSLSRKGRRIVRELKPKRLDVGIRAIDAAGNSARSGRFQRPG